MKYLIEKTLRSLLGKKRHPLRGLSKKEKLLVKRIKSQRLTYLSEKKLGSLIRTLKDIEKNEIDGEIIEAGCALGGSSIILASIKNKSRAQKVYDVFGMIPPPTAEDSPEVHQRYTEIKNGESEGLGDDRYYGYEEDLYQKVTDNFGEFNLVPQNNNVHLIKGLLQETMELNEAVALAHIDVDWYDPVKTCLDRIHPKLSFKGSIILDDYHDWGGCKKATDEFLEDKSDYYQIDKRFATLKLTRIKK